MTDTHKSAQDVLQDSAMDQALDWLITLECANAEQKCAFNDWLNADPAHALAFAKANGISTQDGNGLLRTIRSRTPEQQAELLKVATEGEYWRPTCASCGVKMVEPRGQKFWGCPNFRARGCTNRIYKTAAATVV